MVERETEHLGEELWQVVLSVECEWRGTNLAGGIGTP